MSAIPRRNTPRTWWTLVVAGTACGGACSTEPSFGDGDGDATATATSSSGATSSASTAEATSSASASASASASDASQAVSASSAGGGLPGAGGGGAGGGPGTGGGAVGAICGDGVIDGDETCDDDTDLCVGCRVACPPGWSLAPSGTRCFSAAGEAEVTNFFDAASACQRMSAGGVRGRLASPRTPDDLDAVASLCNGPCFVGAFDLAEESVFRWIDGSPFDDVAADLWSPGQPDDAGDRQDCVALNVTSDALLADVACDMSLPRVCEVVPGWADDAKCGDANDDPGEECQPGDVACEGCNRDCPALGASEWRESPLGSHDCVRSSDAVGTFAEAQAFCLGQGGRLATPALLGELEVGRYVCDAGGTARSCWVGATDTRTEGSFVWVDGTPVDFQDGVGWLAGEPNGGTSENCVVLEGGPLGALNDLDCAVGRWFLCERGL